MGYQRELLLREQRDDRTYQLHMVQEATLAVEHLARNYKLTVLEINLRALITAPATPFCFCAMQKHLTVERIRGSRT